MDIRYLYCFNRKLFQQKAVVRLNYLLIIGKNSTSENMRDFYFKKMYFLQKKPFLDFLKFIIRKGITIVVIVCLLDMLLFISYNGTVLINMQPGKLEANTKKVKKSFLTYTKQNIINSEATLAYINGVEVSIFHQDTYSTKNTKHNPK